MLTGIIYVPLCRTQPLLRRYGQNFGQNNGRAKLTEDQARQVRKLALGGVFTLREIGEMFGVSHTAVSWIKSGRNWKHLWDDTSTETNTNAASSTAKERGR